MKRRAFLKCYRHFGSRHGGSTIANLCRLLKGGFDAITEGPFWPDGARLTLRADDGRRGSPNFDRFRAGSAYWAARGDPLRAVKLAGW